MNDKIKPLKTEHGTFTNNEVTGQTAEEVYQEWLENKDKKIEPDKEEIKDKVKALEDRIKALEDKINKVK